MGRESKYSLGFIASIIFLLIGLFKWDFSYILASIVWFFITLFFVSIHKDKD
jgi:hypothetical membrane protein